MQESDSPKDESYINRADKRDSEYRREYATWYAGLPPEERQYLKAHGLDHAVVDYHISESGCDVTERNIAADEPQVELANDFEKRLWEVIGGIVILLIDSPNIRLEADTLAFMAGFHARMGRSGAELASRYGLTRAAWSKRVKFLQHKLGLPPSRFMKSEAACKVYAQTNGKLRST